MQSLRIVITYVWGIDPTVFISLGKFKLALQQNLLSLNDDNRILPTF